MAHRPAPERDLWFDPGYEYATKAMYQVQKETVPVGARDASAGPYSETNDSQGTALYKALTNVRGGIVQGGNTMGDFESAVARWRSSGGDNIRSEFEKSYAARQG